MTKSEIIIQEYIKNKNVRVKDIYNKHGFSKGLISKVLNQQKFVKTKDKYDKELEYMYKTMEDDSND